VGCKAINLDFWAPFTHFVRELSLINQASVLCYFLLATKEPRPVFQSGKHTKGSSTGRARRSQSKEKNRCTLQRDELGEVKEQIKLDDFVGRGEL
jgi:hypothetical protein